MFLEETLTRLVVLAVLLFVCIWSQEFRFTCSFVLYGHLGSSV